jgi:hypothetical protein
MATGVKVKGKLPPAHNSILPRRDRSKMVQKNQPGCNLIGNKMKNENTAVCRICCMDINPKAKKCPYCHHYQNKWLLMAYHPMTAIIYMIFILGIMGNMLETIFSDGESFSHFNSTVSVVETKMVFGTNAYGNKSPTVVILGKVKNDSPVPWKNIQFEATFFDKDGKLVDAAQKQQYSFFVPAQETVTFKLSFQREFPEEQYKDYKVRIVQAQDGRKRF